jgi:GNAT superfamily N-acetyltransferase
MSKSSSAPTFQFLTEHHISQLVEVFSKHNWPKPRTTFEQYFKEQQQGLRLIWVAYDKEQLAGYITLRWQSLYEPFRKAGIPEIADLNVLPPFRHQGIASQLLEIAEREASKKSQTVGIGVGLYQDYGAAQKLYVKRGYVPDGLGVTYKYQSVTPGDSIPVDDDLVLWFTRKLK